VGIVPATAFLLGIATIAAELISTQAIYQFIPILFFYLKSTISTGHRAFINIMKREFINFIIVVGYLFSWLERLIEYHHHIFIANDQATEWTRQPRGPTG
jgi:hypothetical protein